MLEVDGAGSSEERAVSMKVVGSWASVDGTVGVATFIISDMTKNGQV